ncbi:MAG: crossover junction endodeoxyribonuclease RuvC, partial [Thiohalophilus sp.]
AKEQVQHMVQHLLGLNKLPQEDAADALAVALCHAHLRQSLEHLSPRLPAGVRRLRRRR